MNIEGVSAVDAAGNVYIAGDVTSSDFPTTDGAYDRTLNGDHDAFVAKLAIGSGPLTYSISGTVLDDDNNPITHTTFLVTTAATSTTLTSTTTITPFIDATGRYTLTDYITGTISVITATAQGFEMFPPFLYLPETGQVLDANFVGTKPPDVVPPNLGIKGANWLRFNDDTANTAYNDKGIGWNLETADTIDIDIAEYVPPLPENEDKRVSGLAQAIANFADPLIGEGVYTIIRLQTPPPPDPALRCDFPWESNFIGVDGLLTEDFTQVLRQELGGELGSHANLVITAPLPDVQWRIEDNGQIYIIGKSEDTVYVFDSPYYFDGTYDRHNMNKSCDDLSNWMSLLDTEVDSIINHPAIVNANPKPVQIFILGNEPNHFKDEWNYSGSEYAHLYNCYYQHWIEREELQDEQGDRLYALFAAGPGQIGPCERVVAGFVGDTPQWVDPNNYETGHQNCKGIDAQNSYANTHGYVPFYQEMLTTGVETIEYADGFAIHAYGYDAAGMVFDRDVTKFPPDGWLATAMDQIRT